MDRARGSTRRLALLGVVVVLVVAGVLGYMRIDHSAGRPTAGPTTALAAAPSISAAAPLAQSPSPSAPPASPAPLPTQTPTPRPTTWVDLIPPNPYTDMNKVPMPKDLNGFPSGGLIKVDVGQVPPHFFLDIEVGTIYAVYPNLTTNTVLVGLDLGGRSITREDCVPMTWGGAPPVSQFDTRPVTIDACTYYGARLWIEMDAHTSLWTGGLTSRKVGTGLTALAPYLQVGRTLTGLGVFFARTWDDNTPTLTDQHIRLNYASWYALNNDIGRSMSRADRSITFYVSGFNV